MQRSVVLKFLLRETSEMTLKNYVLSNQICEVSEISDLRWKEKFSWNRRIH